MSAVAEAQLVREARRVLRRLAKGAFLKPMANGDCAILSGDKSASAGARLEAPVAAAMRARGWLEADAQDPGRLCASEAGVYWLKRAEAAEDAFAAQHQVRVERTVTDADGTARTVTANAAESPLGRLYLRKFVSALQHEAGERLARDYTLAHLMPRMGVDWSQPILAGRGHGHAGRPLTETAVAARQRFHRALDAVGPGLSDVLFDLCCRAAGLEQLERARGWPRASAKVVVGLALDRLAAHYGMGVTRRRAPIRAWAQAEDAPGTDECAD